MAIYEVNLGQLVVLLMLSLQ